MGCLYVLDEPSIGLHQRDNRKLIATLVRLRDLGNTVIVVEHDEETMLAADHLMELGPGAGEHGGEIVAQGTVEGVPEERRGDGEVPHREDGDRDPRHASSAPDALSGLRICSECAFSVRSVGPLVPVGLTKGLAGAVGAENHRDTEGTENTRGHVRYVFFGLARQPSTAPSRKERDHGGRDAMSSP